MVQFQTVLIFAVSFDLGGEKLKVSRPRLGVFITALLIIAGFFSVVFPLSAQTVEPASGAEAPVPAPQVFDESAILFDDPLPAAPGVPGASSTLIVVRMVLVLALAALAIYGVVFFIKRLARPQEARDPHLKLLARVPLSTDSFAAVVSLGPKAWLVGGASGGVNLIAEIDDAETLETLLIDDARRNAAAETRGFDFRSLLQRFGRNPGGKTVSPSGSFAENLRKQRERLRGL